MLPYWILFSLGAVLAFAPSPNKPTGLYWMWVTALAAALAVFIGYRFEIGADWISYEYIFRAISTYPLNEVMTLSDFSYVIVNIIVYWFGGAIWHVNLLCAIIFVYGLFRFCFTLPNPFLGIATAIPYLVIVVAMGFTRQATAIGCIMIAIASYRGGLNAKTLFWLVVAVTFHKSAIVMLPIFIFATSKNRTLNIGIGLAIAALLGFTLIAGELDRLLELYIGGEMQSEGAGIRLALSASAAVFFIIFMNKRELLGEGLLLWRYMAITALALVPIYFVTSSSTAIDRLAFLLLPFQVFVYSYIPKALSDRATLRIPIIAVVVAIDLLILLVWLLYAEHSQYWLPYRNIITEAYPGSSVF